MAQAQRPARPQACSNVSLLTLKCFQLVELCDRLVSTSEVSHSKQGRDVIDGTYQISNSKSYETSAVSLFCFCLSTPVVLVMLTVTRVRLLVVHSSPQIFKDEKRMLTAYSLSYTNCHPKIVHVDEAY